MKIHLYSDMTGLSVSLLLVVVRFSFSNSIYELAFYELVFRIFYELSLSGGCHTNRKIAPSDLVGVIA